jgi:hypothetical protein
VRLDDQEQMVLTLMAWSERVGIEMGETCHIAVVQAPDERTARGMRPTWMWTWHPGADGVELHKTECQRNGGCAGCGWGAGDHAHEADEPPAEFFNRDPTPDEDDGHEEPLHPEALPARTDA